MTDVKCLAVGGSKVGESQGRKGQKKGEAQRPRQTGL